MDDPRYPYHKDVPEKMARLRQVGLELWSEEQSRKWICKSCGHDFDWFSQACPGCGVAVNLR
jgi:rubrerythrin